jgi:hypothetical protein
MPLAVEWWAGSDVDSLATTMVTLSSSLPSKLARNKNPDVPTKATPCRRHSGGNIIFIFGIYFCRNLLFGQIQNVWLKFGIVQELFYTEDV